MRDINRIDNILDELKKIWKQYPDIRLGQLIASSANYGVIYYAEDNQLLELIKQMFPVKEVIGKETIEAVNKIDSAEIINVDKSDKVAVQEANKPIIVAKQKKKTYKKEEIEDSADYIYMHRGSVVKRVPVDKVDEWLHLGYEKGRK